MLYFGTTAFKTTFLISTSAGFVHYRAIAVLFYSASPVYYRVVAANSVSSFDLAVS